MERKLFLAYAFLLLACSCLLVACNGDDAKSAWNAVVKKCAVSDLNSDKILYFGPSNNVGPGSIWRVADAGGYRLRWTLDKMPGEKAFVNEGSFSSCAGSTATRFGLTTALGLTSQIAPASGELSNDFQKAKSIEVSVASMTWETIIEGPFEGYIKALPANNAIRQDLGQGNRLVLSRALRVSGYAATLEFNTSDIGKLKAKYSGQLAKAITGDLNPELSASWTSENKLVLSSTKDFYIAGELSPYTAAGFAKGGTSRFGQPILIDQSRAVKLDD